MRRPRWQGVEREIRDFHTIDRIEVKHTKNPHSTETIESSLAK